MPYDCEEQWIVVEAQYKQHRAKHQVDLSHCALPWQYLYNQLASLFGEQRTLVAGAEEKNTEIPLWPIGWTNAPHFVLFLPSTSWLDVHQRSVPNHSPSMKT